MSTGYPEGKRRRRSSSIDMRCFSTGGQRICWINSIEQQIVHGHRIVRCALGFVLGIVTHMQRSVTPFACNCNGALWGGKWFEWQVFLHRTDINLRAFLYPTALTKIRRGPAISQRLDCLQRVDASASPGCLQQIETIDVGEWWKRLFQRCCQVVMISIGLKSNVFWTKSSSRVLITLYSAEGVTLVTQG